jgi:lipopolysaccharide/colanic/teichoic acid biosynthesis glycosyltransferase
VSRALDVAVAALALAAASPLLAACALAIRLDSRGPVLYRQRRVGRDGEPFELYKLRTMVVGAEHRGAGLYIEDRDPRITRVGRLLRRLSLDELPNLLNVLRGELAIVGPRPTVQEQVDRYTPHQRRRLEVRPGITGWAQVNGRASLSWPERIELDVWYVDNRSLALDLRILARTVRMLVTGHGLYSTDLTQGWGEQPGAGAPDEPTVPPRSD